MPERDTNDIFAEISAAPGFLRGWTVVLWGIAERDYPGHPDVELARVHFTTWAAALAYANRAMPDFIRIPVEGIPTPGTITPA